MEQLGGRSSTSKDSFQQIRDSTKGGLEGGMYSSNSSAYTIFHERLPDKPATLKSLPCDEPVNINKTGSPSTSNLQLGKPIGRGALMVSTAKCISFPIRVGKKLSNSDPD